MADCRLLAAALLFGMLSAAQAEIVRVEGRGGSFGQGWLHVAPDGACRVAMPAHVVPADGKAIATDVKGRQYDLASPYRPDDDVDLALMTVPVPRGTICTASRLGPSSLSGQIAGLGEARLETHDSTERQSIIVELVAASVDEQAGAVLAFRPRHADDRLRQGMSGSTIFAADGTMIAMLTDVDPGTGIGIALRFDRIRHLAALAPPDAGAAGPPMAVLVAAGRVNDGTGPSVLLAPGGMLTLSPVERTLALLVLLDTPAKLVGLHLGVGCGAEQIQRAGLSVRLVPDNPFSAEIACRLSTGEAQAISCSLAPRLGRELRLAVRTTGEAPVCLSGLALSTGQ